MCIDHPGNHGIKLRQERHVASVKIIAQTALFASPFYTHGAPDGASEASGFRPFQTNFRRAFFVEWLNFSE
jgi:hypothetical protein